jgi:hypothetical protein
VYLICLSWYHVLAFDPTSISLSFAAFQRYTISKHYRRSITGLQFHHIGDFATRIITDFTTGSISISIRGVFWTFLFFAFLLWFGKTSKGEPHRLRLRFEDMESRIDGFSQIMSSTFPVSFSCVQNSAWRMLLLRRCCRQ